MTKMIKMVMFNKKVKNKRMIKKKAAIKIQLLKTNRRIIKKHK
jgi:hypothetical protein